MRVRRSRSGVSRWRNHALLFTLQLAISERRKRQKARRRLSSPGLLTDLEDSWIDCERDTAG